MMSSAIGNLTQSLCRQKAKKEWSAAVCILTIPAPHLQRDVGQVLDLRVILKSLPATANDGVVCRKQVSDAPLLRVREYIGNRNRTTCPILSQPEVQCLCPLFAVSVAACSVVRCEVN